jgi:hypothetical protein
MLAITCCDVRGRGRISKGASCALNWSAGCDLGQPGRYGITLLGTLPIRHQPVWFGPVTAA